MDSSGLNAATGCSIDDSTIAQDDNDLQCELKLQEGNHDL